MVVTDFFDRAVCINLDHRQDKWDESELEFAKHGLSVQRHPAVDGDYLDYSGPLKKGVIGCFMSHRDVLESARKDGLSSILVFEDDVAFDDDLNVKFHEWYPEVPLDWDMLYLGGNHNAKTIEKCSPHLMRATQTQTTHAYAVRSGVFDMILERLQTIDLDVDVVYTEIQKQCKAYCFTPRLAWQRPSVSDIWKQRVDYDFIRDNDGCHKTME